MGVSLEHTPNQYTSCAQCLLIWSGRTQTRVRTVSDDPLNWLPGILEFMTTACSNRMSHTQISSTEVTMALKLLWCKEGNRWAKNIGARPWALTQDFLWPYRQLSQVQQYPSSNDALCIWHQGLVQELAASPDRHHRSEQKGRRRTSDMVADRTVFKNMETIPWSHLETVGQVEKEERRI